MPSTGIIKFTASRAEALKKKRVGVKVLPSVPGPSLSNAKAQK